jgi:MoaA/NifB/PqqE/SkfB family radical SAM enzyme
MISRKNKVINEHLYSSLLDQIADTACYLMLYLQGEPFLNPCIFDMIRQASGKRIFTGISTNGHFLDEHSAEQTIRSCLDRIIISLDGTTNDTYNQYRAGGNFQKVLDGIKNLVEMKKRLRSKTPHIILQFIVFKHNQHQIEEFRALGSKLGVNKTELKSAQLHDFEVGNPRMTDIDKFSRYQKKDDIYIIKNKQRNQCKRLWAVGVITSDGVLVPCCYDKTAEHPIGTTENNLKSLWKGKEFMKFREQILKKRRDVDICGNCDG